MKANRILVVITTSLFGVSLVLAPSASAATKTITCYKGTAVKKITAKTPKCPTGWSLKKPTPTPSASASNKTVAFTGTYSGTLTMLWSDSSVDVQSLKGTSTNAGLGLMTISAEGGSNPSSTCSTFFGTGTLTGKDGTLKFKVDPKSMACAESESAPTKVSTGSTSALIIQSGTGKFLGATGALKANGSFKIGTTDAGKSDTQNFNLVISGDISLK